MAHCPKCGKKLKLTDVSQFCPACGVNMRFVNFEENFYKEAKYAELSQARMHVIIKRLKAAFLGSWLTVTRLIAVLFPIVSLLIPSGSFTIRLPFSESTTKFGLLGLFDLLKNGDLNYLLQMRASVLSGSAFSALLTTLAAYACVVLFAALTLLLSLLCFLSIQKMQKVICAAAGLGIISSVAAMVMISFLKKTSAESELISVKSGFSLLITVAMFSVVFVCNYLIDKKGIPVEYGEGMLARAEIFRQVKAGDISIDDLPQPVVQTAETKKIDEEIMKEEQHYKQKHQKEGSENV